MLPIEDEIIIDRYIVRDERAISYTADKYGKQLVAIANRICDDLDIAEECENDTYLRMEFDTSSRTTRLFFYFSGKNNQKSCTGPV